MKGQGLRMAVGGASGALGRELLAVLDERRVPVCELRAFGTDHSVGEEVELAGEAIPVESEPPPLGEVDLLVLCTPAEASLELIRMALRAELPCIDCSGALAGSREVPFLVAGLSAATAGVGAPVVCAPAGPALAWALALSALERAAGVRRVVGTVLQSAALAGRPGIDALSSETIALLSQQEPPTPQVFRGQVAFDCVPTIGERDGGDGGAMCVEAALVRDLQRLLGAPVPISATCVQVPTFVGEGSALCVETAEALSVEEAAEVFEKGHGVELWREDEIGPTTRDTAGRDAVLIGRLRRDPSCERSLLFWIAADPLRLAASNAVSLIEARLHH